MGRFAPSPTGPLHLGSLVAALASYLDARANGGRWLVRVDDIDPPRVVPGAADAILRSLDRHGLHWDAEVVRQSVRAPAYEAALASLAREGWTYPCGCSRRALVDGRYPGHCRSGMTPGMTARSVRVRTPDEPVGLDDAVQGRCRRNLWRETGDFVVRRADGPPAYHLATVVDDAAEGVTHIVRGADLLESTPLQRFLQMALSLPAPAYAHVPVVTDRDRLKLGKQTRAPALDEDRPGASIASALTFLGHPPPPALIGAAPAELLQWGTASWCLSAVPRVRSRPVG